MKTKSYRWQKIAGDRQLFAGGGAGLHVFFLACGRSFASVLLVRGEWEIFKRSNKVIFRIVHFIDDPLHS